MNKRRWCRRRVASATSTDATGCCRDPLCNNAVTKVLLLAVLCYISSQRRMGSDTTGCVDAPRPLSTCLSRTSEKMGLLVGASISSLSHSSLLFKSVLQRGSGTGDINPLSSCCLDGQPGASKTYGVEIYCVPSTYILPTDDVRSIDRLRYLVLLAPKISHCPAQKRFKTCILPSTFLPSPF